MNIRFKTQSTPNPKARKYIIDRPVKSEGKVSYSNEDEADHVPLAIAILRLANVTQVHFYDNVLTVTQNGASAWEALDDAMGFILEDYMAEHDPGFAAQGDQKPIDRTHKSQEIQDIEKILDRTVRPGLQADGGDLEVLELDGKILSIRYEGACGGCPSAMFGTLQAIEGILQNEYQDDLQVVAV